MSRASGWHNTLESFKCGKNVRAQWCDSKRLWDEGKCHKKGKGESASGWAESQAVGMLNTASHLVLTPYDPENSDEVVATVFSETNCHGNSSVIRNRSGDTRNELNTGNDIKSIMFASTSFDDSTPTTTNYRAEFFKYPNYNQGIASRSGIRVR